MQVKDYLNSMIDKVNQCLSKGIDGDDISWDQLSGICKCTSECAVKISLNREKRVPFGRYLVFQNEKFNVQLDIFSRNYVGLAHNHETWGVMCCISGELGVTEYVKSDDKLQLIRKGFLRTGSALGFKKESDWHSTETFEGDQVASFHIYGNGFDLEHGFRYSNATGVEKYRRGTLNDYSKFSKILVLND